MVLIGSSHRDSTEHRSHTLLRIEIFINFISLTTRENRNLTIGLLHFHSNSVNGNTILCTIHYCIINQRERTQKEGSNVKMYSILILKFQKLSPPSQNLMQSAVCISLQKHFFEAASFSSNLFLMLFCYWLFQN